MPILNDDQSKWAGAAMTLLGATRRELIAVEPREVFRETLGSPFHVHHVENNESPLQIGEDVVFPLQRVLPEQEDLHLRLNASPLPHVSVLVYQYLAPTMAIQTRSLESGEDMTGRSVQISVIIPTFNRADALRRCLEALESQTLPPTEFEAIVVVDGSTDGTARLLSLLKPGFSLRVHEQENAGPGAARNAGTGLARGRFGLFIDDDIVAAPELVETHLRFQATHPRAIGIGRVTIELGPQADGFARYFARWYETHNRRLAEDPRRPTYIDCYSNNLSMPIGSIHELGGFATDLPRSEDVELGFRLAKEGLGFAFLSGALGVSLYEKGFSEISELAERAGIAGVELARRHPDMAESLQLRSFCGGGRIASALGRVLFALGAPTAPLRAGSSLLPGRGRISDGWYRFLYDYFYWRGVRQAASSPEWLRLTAGNSA